MAERQIDLQKDALILTNQGKTCIFGDINRFQVYQEARGRETINLQIQITKGSTLAEDRYIEIKDVLRHYDYDNDSIKAINGIKTDRN